MANVVSDFGRLDILVNNAGVGHVGPHTEDTTDEEWSLAIGVMQNGVFYCMRSAASHLLKRGSGRVVNISSIRGLSPKPGRIAYCAAKAAVIMMTKVAAAEWGASGVTVNAIAPGFLRTEMWETAVAGGVVDEAEYAQAVPARRIGEPAEVAKLVAFLCSSDAAYINGAVIAVDGGATAVPLA
jgi:NAD(P)-dependent dehydrogenase (short-subunit alcohol dehydrogenase family)